MKYGYESDNLSNKYLYDICLSDSELEKKNIMLDNDEVIAFGKIPLRSIRIPLIDGASYSSDFMYVVIRIQINNTQISSLIKKL